MSETPPPAQTTFADVTLICKDCGKPFTFTAKEQQFFVKQGFEHVPTRCADCRRDMRLRREKGRPFISIKCKVTNKVGRLPIEVDDPNDAFTEEAFEQTFATQGKLVDPLKEKDLTHLIEERRAAKVSEPQAAA